MTMYFILGVLTIILMLAGYLVFLEYRDNITFRGERFTESYGVRRILDFVIPKETRILDNKLFYLFGDTVSIRDFYVVKLVSFMASLILAFAVMTTNFLNNRVEVFEKERDFPFLISSEDFLHLTEDLSFQTLDMNEDFKLIVRNKSYVEDRSKYLNVDVEILYNVLKDMHSEYENAFGIGIIFTGFLVICGGWYLPSFVIWLLFLVMENNMSYEFAHLEGYIYINCGRRVPDILKGLCVESTLYRQLMSAFYLRYTEDRTMAYDLVLSDTRFSTNFRTLVGYLKLLEDSDFEVVKDKIKVNQDNFKTKLREDTIRSTNDKRYVLKLMLYGSVMLNLIGILITLFKTM